MLFHAVNFDVNVGEIVQILGENGAGKTTLLKILAGLIDHYQGQVTLSPPKLPSFQPIDHGYATRLLYLGHKNGVKESLTPIENLKWYFGLHGSGRRTRLVEADFISALTQVGLRGYESTPCSQLSAGQKKRVGLARLYCSEASLWLLDEPFTAIDIKGVAQLESRITEHANQGGLVLFTSHQTTNMSPVRTLNVSEFALSIDETAALFDEQENTGADDE